MPDTLLADAQDLENKASAFQTALAKAATDAATAQTSAAARDQAHVDLQAAIAKVVSDAQALDTAPATPAPAPAPAPAA
jgi:hypothetical protein